MFRLSPPLPVLVGSPAWMMKSFCTLKKMQLL